MSSSYRQILWCSALCLVTTFVLSPLPAQSRSSPANGILGTWRGSSICVDPTRDTACHDEEVIYHVDSAASPTGPVRMQADKVVNGSRQRMGALQLRYDTTAHAWWVELSTRFHARWSFEPQGDRMVGTLDELPSGRVVRRVAVRRAS